MTLERWLALACAVVICLMQPVSNVLRVIAFLLIPLAAIWFPDEIGTYANPKGSFTETSPPILIRIMGWVLLLIFLATRLYLKYRLA